HIEAIRRVHDLLEKLVYDCPLSFVQPWICRCLKQRLEVRACLRGLYRVGAASGHGRRHLHLTANRQAFELRLCWLQCRHEPLRIFRNARSKRVLPVRPYSTRTGKPCLCGKGRITELLEILLEPMAGNRILYLGVGEKLIWG